MNDYKGEILLLVFAICAVAVTAVVFAYHEDYALTQIVELLK